MRHTATWVPPDARALMLCTLSTCMPTPCTAAARARAPLHEHSCPAHAQGAHAALAHFFMPCTALHTCLSLPHAPVACMYVPALALVRFVPVLNHSFTLCTHTSTTVPPDPKPCSRTPYPCTHPTHALIHAHYPCRHPTHTQPCIFLPQISAHPCPPPHPSVRLPPPCAQCRAPFSSCFIFVSQLLSPLPTAAPVPPSPHSLAMVITASHTSLLPASAQPPSPLRAPLLFTPPPVPSIPSFLSSPSLPRPTPPRSSLHAACPVPSPPCPSSPPHPRLTPLLQPSKFPPELGCGEAGKAAPRSQPRDAALPLRALPPYEFYIITHFKVYKITSHKLLRGNLKYYKCL